MDRREALKKLGAGGALVMASPVILPTFRVAHAASPGETDLVGVPEAGEPQPFGAFPFPDDRNDYRQISIAPDMSGVTCAGGGTPIITYEWRIVSVVWGSPWWIQQLRVTEVTGNRNDPAGTQLAITPPSLTSYNGPTAYSAPSSGSAFLVRKRYLWGDGWIPSDDRYAVEMRVRWHCDGATSDIEAEYLFNGVGTNSPTVTNTSWNVVSA